MLESPPPPPPPGSPFVSYSACSFVLSLQRGGEPSITFTLCPRGVPVRVERADGLGREHPLRASSAAADHSGAGVDVSR